MQWLSLSFESVFDASYSIPYFTLGLVTFAFSLKFLVAGHFPSTFLDLATHIGS